MLLNRFEVVERGHARILIKVIGENGSWRSARGHRMAAIKSRKRAPKTGWIHTSAYFECDLPITDFNPSWLN